MTLKHTPGPWFVSRYRDPQGRQWIASNAAHDDTGQAEDVALAVCDSDARLISAAPDLLTALQYVTDILSSSVAPDDYEPFRACISQARAAITKATGE
jgi:hypothetical protein